MPQSSEIALNGLSPSIDYECPSSIMVLSRRRRRYLTLDALGVANFSDAQIIGSLQVQPRARISAKVASQPHRRVRSDCTAFSHDVINALCWDIQSFGQGRRNYAEGSQIVFAKYLAGMHRPHSISKHRSFQIV